MPSDKIGTVMRAYCAKCRGQRNCEVAGHHGESGQDAYNPYSWNMDWYLLVCRGCDNVFAQSVSTDSENLDYDHGPDGEPIITEIETIHSWPAKSKRDTPEWFAKSIDSDLKTFDLDRSLFELYGALDQDLTMLAAIGIRTSFDVASELLGIDSELRFEQKLEALLEKKLIKEHDREQIATLIDAGSASAHRGWKPDIDDLNALMDILEAFIFDSFVAPARRKKSVEKLARLKSAVPLRKKKARKTKTPPAPPA